MCRITKRDLSVTYATSSRGHRVSTPQCPSSLVRRPARSRSTSEEHAPPESRRFSVSRPPRSMGRETTRKGRTRCCRWSFRAMQFRYSRTVCGIVYEGSGRQTGCQFSFTSDESEVRRPERKGWEIARTEAAKRSQHACFGLLGARRTITRTGAFPTADRVSTRSHRFTATSSSIRETKNMKLRYDAERPSAAR